MRIYFPACLLIGIVLATACGPAGTPVPVATDALPPSPFPTREPAVSPTLTATIFLSPTPETPLPSYPNITLPDRERLRAIFTSGARGGMRSGIFSKVGDSITANGYFLAPFGTGDYALGGYGYLQEVIGYYLREDAYEGNSFVHDSFSARTSWRAEHVLDPARARPPCEAGESPLGCECRLVQPAVAVIMLGTNDVMAGTGIGDYRETLHKIVIHMLNRGVIPILTTLPVLRGKDAEPYNAVIRDLAQRWDIPLIDLSIALAGLPNAGLSPDGVHLSWIEPAVLEAPYLNHGMTVRNLLTLQALDAVWRSFPPAE
ncbi:MAG: hypothetical protein A3K46_05555 [Chloroflexi bacterium RBG_13_60_9]|nr:MAG: hypothetical protein A3K46_05555 [Chloroflexi bacterium RBG_13_60_9]